MIVSASSSSSHTRLSTTKSRWRVIFLSLSGLFGVPIAVLVISNALPAGAGPLPLAGSMVWAYIGSNVVLAALIAAVLGIVALVWHRSIPAIIIATVAVVGLVGSVVFTASIAVAASRAGGGVNVFSALTPTARADFSEQTTQYVTDAGESLDVDVLTPQGGADDAPVMMYIHGGGWTSGSPDDAALYAGRFAQDGYVVVSVAYDLSTADQATWDVAPQQVACALTWTVANASSFGGNPDHLIISGDSAGGNLALNLGWAAAQGEAQSACPSAGNVPVPDAILAGYPVGDVEATYAGSSFFGLEPSSFVTDYLGGSPAEYPDRTAAVSPETYISPSTPPTLILQPTRDEFVPVDGNLALVAKAQQSGADVELVEVPFSAHGYDSFPNSVGGQFRYSVQVRFLQALGLTPVP